MWKDYEARHLFLALGIVILMVSPIFLLLFPAFIANTLYNTPEDWHIYVPGVAYVFYSIGFLFLVIAPAIIFILDIRKKSIIFGMTFLLLGGVFFYIASGPYKSLTSNSISYRVLFSTEKHTYSWEEVEKVVYYEIPSEEGFSKYEFFFSDGTSMELNENGHIRLLRENIRSKIPVETIRTE